MMLDSTPSIYFQYLIINHHENWSIRVIGSSFSVLKSTKQNTEIEREKGQNELLHNAISCTLIYSLSTKV